MSFFDMFGHLCSHNRKTGLCVGINDYRSPENNLIGCVNDALDFKSALEKRGFKMDILLDQKAKRNVILQKLRGAMAKTRDGDIFVFQFSGHGSQVYDENGDEPDGLDEIICSADIIQTGEGIVDDELNEIFRMKAAGAKVIFISDSCHSGTVSRVLSYRKPRFMHPSVFKPELYGSRDIVLRSKSTIFNCLLFAGCQDTGYSYDAVINERPNGAFSYYALKCLEILPAGATYNAWLLCVRYELPSQEYDQTPELYGAKFQKEWKVFE